MTHDRAVSKQQGRDELSQAAPDDCNDPDARSGLE
jgi:hypothetical protein